MDRILILVEGQTEERFVKEVLGPHLQQLGGLVAIPVLLKTKRVKSGPDFKGRCHQFQTSAWGSPAPSRGLQRPGRYHPHRLLRAAPELSRNEITLTSLVPPGRMFPGLDFGLGMPLTELPYSDPRLRGIESSKCD